MQECTWSLCQTNAVHCGRPCALVTFWWTCSKNEKIKSCYDFDLEVPWWEEGMHFSTYSYKNSRLSWNQKKVNNNIHCTQSYKWKIDINFISHWCHQTSHDWERTGDIIVTSLSWRRLADIIMMSSCLKMMLSVQSGLEESKKKSKVKNMIFLINQGVKVIWKVKLYFTLMLHIIIIYIANS